MDSTHLPIRLKVRVLLPLTLVGVLIFAISITAFYLQEQAHLTEDVARSIQGIEGHLDTILAEHVRKLSVGLETISNEEEMRAALKAGDRERLLSLYAPLFKRLKTRFDITHFYFHDSRRINLLRVHQPARHGDTINRFTALGAERTGRSAHGLELGPLGTFTPRAVLPLFDGEERLGYLELGEEIDTVLSDLRRVMGVELFITIDKRYLDREKWTEGMEMLGRRGEWERFPERALITRSLPEVPEALGRILARATAELPTDDIEVTWNKRHFRGRLLPLVDAGGRTVGHLVALRDQTAWLHATQRSLLFIAAGSLLLGGILFVLFHDLLGKTERELSESHEEVARSRNILQTVNEFASDFIYWRSADQQTLIYASPAAEKVTGHPADAFTRDPGLIDAIIYPEDRDAWEAHLPSDHGEHLPMEIRLLTRCGKIRWMSHQCLPIFGADGRYLGRRGNFSDITEKKHAEQRLLEAKRAAEQAAKAKGKFLANMSHELRTPMNGVIGMLQLLANTPLREDQQGYLKIALHSADLQLTVINDILDFSKIEAGRLHLERIEFSLAETVETVATMLGENAHAKGLELTTFVDPELPRRVVGDPTRVRQILVNLLTNAVKFTERGEVKIRVEPERETRIRFIVEDTGIGIPPDSIEKLFQPFTQADGSTTRRFGGTGLGLTISRQLVEAMGGGIDVESRPGAGSRFYFTVPLPPARRSEPTMADQLHGLRFLVVDDNATNRTILERHLESWNLRCDVVAGGPEALTQIHQAADQRPPIDVVLLDMHMPEMDGLEVARAIVGEAATTPPRILLLTSGAQPSRTELARSGIGAAIAKPVGPSRLLDAIGTLLESAPGQGEAPAAELPETRLSGLRVLLAEDNRVNQQVAVGMLLQLGIAAEVVNNGLKALERMEREPFDLVLMDVQMPEMDGIEATRQYRAREAERDERRLLIVALTAHALSGDRERFLEIGMDDYLAKPLQFVELKAMLERHFADEKGDSPAPSTPATEAPSTTTTPLAPQAVETLRASLSSIPGGFARVIDAYLTDGEAALSELEQGVDDGDAERLHRAAHSMKSQSAAVGAMDLSELCRELEEMGRNGELNNAEEKVSQARAAFLHTLPALRELKESESD